MTAQGVKMLEAEITYKNEKEKESLIINLSLMSIMNFEFNLESNTKYNQELTKVDVGNSINSNELTDEYYNAFEKITTNKGFTKLLNDLQNIDLDDIYISN